jgi:hypothetical protein
MNDHDAEKIIRLLEEIRDDQRLQLERQAQALAGLSNRSNNALGLGERADRILAKSAKLVAAARILTFVALPFAVLLLAFVVWVIFARVAP